MQTRRRAVSPLTLVLPHPQFVHNRSSLISPGTSPHTPHSRMAPLPLFSPSTNRKSSDSWNSSIHDDEMDWEWRQEETLLLQRTLDALPAHLLTPFNGAVPPSNLLDKIARGVSQAKGPAEWPHSLRATRSKIVELARIRAKESIQVDIIEESGDDAPRDILRPTGRTNRKRPLYRQNSMDFLLDVDLSIKDNQTINRRSQRLQRTDRFLPNSPYHPTSPVKTRGTQAQYSSVLPSTPSSSTLNSSSSLSSSSPKAPALRRSFSSLSSSSDAYSSYPLNPRVQRMKRAESFAAPVAHVRNTSLRHAPSYSADSATSNTLSVDESTKDHEVISSDEEEKLRTKQAKKFRRRSPPVSPSPVPTERASKNSKVPTKSCPTPSSKQPPAPAPTATATTKKATRPRANLERNPSILGGELPKPQAQPSPPSHRMSVDAEEPGRNASDLSTAHRTLRRVKAKSFAVHPVARRISFGSVGSPQEENFEPHGAGFGLGSAFQLR